MEMEIIWSLVVGQKKSEISRDIEMGISQHVTSA